MTTSLSSDNARKVPLPRTVWALGITMFLMNLSFVIIYSFSGVYLKSLGTSTTWIGLFEGVAEASSFAMKLFSGMLSDFVRRRKPVMIFGYILSILCRPVIAISTSFSLVFIARVFDRFGNGIQATPRDAMVADVAPPKRIGAAYGLKRSLATAGSFLGAVCGIFGMYWTSNNYQKVFAFACIPAFLAFALLLFVIKEPKTFKHPAVSSEVPLPAPKRLNRLKWARFSLLGKAFWSLMVVNAIFMLARMGETFLTLHAHGNLGLPTAYIPFVMMLFNAGWCASSYPVGVMADRMNRYWFLSLGIIFLVLADLILASSTTLWLFTLGVLCWGIQYGITQNIFMSLIAETVPEDLRGTALGFYYIISAVSCFFADTTAGVISQHYGEPRAFFVSGIIGLFALIALTFVQGRKRTS